MIVLDTNVLSELIKPQGSTIVRNWASQQPVKVCLLQQLHKLKYFMASPYYQKESVNINFTTWEEKFS
jgi:predicted nucleic acid-binding protein